MNTTELVQADRETMMIVGTFALAINTPETWERFTDRMFDEWGKRNGIDLAALEGRNPAGRPTEAENPLSDVPTAASDNDAATPPNDGGGTPTNV